MPSRWSILLDVQDASRVRPEQLYGMISTWFEGHLDRDGHHAPRKPYTISPLRPLAGRPAHQVAIDIGLLRDDLAPALLRGAEELATASGRLGGQPVRCIPWEDGRLGAVHSALDWEELTAAPAVGDRFLLTLLSPLTFRSGQLYQPFPLAGLVLGHLREQWSQWGPTVPHATIEDCAVAVENYQLSAARVTLRGRSVLGSTGEIGYRVGSREPVDRAAIGRWLAVLPYSALGADTRMGLGQGVVTLSDGRPARPGRRPGRDQVAE